MDSIRGGQAAPVGATSRDRRHTYDKATLSRILWAQHVLRNTCGLTLAQTRPSHLIRRAMESYCVHLDTVLTAADYRELRIRAEGAAVVKAAQGDDLHVHDVQLTALPVRSLNVILREQREKQPSVMQTLERDLRRWGRTSTPQTEGVHDDVIEAEDPTDDEE